MTVLLVALGAIVGAPLRYLVDRAVRARHDTTFPWGTLTVNVAASLLLGFLAGADAHVPAAMAALLGTGFCGALSTYSTFGYENQQLVVTRARFDVVANVSISVVAGIGAAALGWSLGLSVS
jgi:CrcB protein